MRGACYMIDSFSFFFLFIVGFVACGGRHLCRNVAGWCALLPNFIVVSFRRQLAISEAPTLLKISWAGLSYRLHAENEHVHFYQVGLSLHQTQMSCTFLPRGVSRFQALTMQSLSAVGDISIHYLDTTSLNVTSNFYSLNRFAISSLYNGWPSAFAVWLSSVYNGWPSAREAHRMG